jgi:hypothetical protein
MPNQNADLWGFNPQTQNLYTVGERRANMRSRDIEAGRIPQFQGVAPDPRWDEWFDRVHSNRVMQTAGIDTSPGNTQALEQLRQLGTQPGVNDRLIGELGDQKVRWGAGRSPAGSNQLTGYSAQPMGSIASNPASTWNTNQAGQRPWGVGSAPMQGLQAAGPAATRRPSPPMLTDREQAASRSPRRPY